MTIESLPLVDTPAGIFTFLRPDGIPDTVGFYVRCEPRPHLSDPDFTTIMDRRNDALNEQFTEAWRKLENENYTQIRYIEVKPDPFFSSTRL